MGATVAEVAGREEELSTADGALSAAGVVVFCGEAGIGKTTLWEAVTAAAAASGRRLLVTRPVEAERSLALASLADLLGSVADEVLPRLPPPQRHALEAALLLSEGGPRPPDVRTLGAALLGSLRVVGGDQCALLAVDDLQWVDRASRVVLEFALRRLSTVPASAVLTVRTGGDGERLPVFDPASPLAVVKVGPLSLGATQRLLADRLGASLPRLLLRRIHKASGGNPLYALELARALRDVGPLSPEDSLPVPRQLDLLLRERIAALPARTRRALATAAALSEPRVGWVGREGDLQPALDDGLVRVERGIVRFGHPLLASTAYSLLAPRRRRELHGRLAGLVVDLEERARHLALAHPGPDESVATELEIAAKSALGRGAPLAAAELLELALERTLDRECGSTRRLEAARTYLRAGDLVSARRLAEEAVAQLTAGPKRAHALMILSTARRDDFTLAAALAEQAWQEATGDRGAEARAASALSYFRGLAGDMQAAHVLAQQAVARADALPAAAEVATVAMAAFMELHWSGRLDPALVARGLGAEERSGGLSDGWETRYIQALAMLLDERYEEARVEVEALITQKEALGFELGLGDLLDVLAVIETHAGRPAAGAAAAARAVKIREQLGFAQADVVLVGYFAALPAAYLGRVDEVRELTSAGMEAAAQTGCLAFAVEHAHVLGFLELSLGNAKAAVQVLEPVARRLAEVAPGMHPMHVPVLPNLIEALITLGRFDEAQTHLERLETRGRKLGSAWALSQAATARGLLAAGQGDLTLALAWFDKALQEHQPMGPFERGRTLLAQGAVLRRVRRWRAARESLNAALAIFEEMEAALWADKARLELGRIGGRRPAGGLTATEERIATLVATGRSNKEIASELFVTVRTVEAHLTTMYAKLGVHSRGQLAHRISA